MSTELAHLDDDALESLLADRPTKEGWGTTRTVQIAGERVFVKVIPITDPEHARMFSTRNHYRLPMAYQYGVGSAGFGVWREVVTHIKTTNWVLEEAIGTFPLTYHVRTVRRAERTGPWTPPSMDDYIRYWNSSRSIARYVADRATGKYAAVLFLEHVPHSLWEWLATRPEDTDRMVRPLCDTVSFLRSRGVIHFDAHFSNAVTDGDRVYLADFGLVLDSRFHLTTRERAFLERHTHYDYGVILYSVGALVAGWYGQLPEAEQEVARELVGGTGDLAAIYRALVREVDRLTDLLHPTLVQAVVRYREVIDFMADFFTRLRASRRKNTWYDDDELRDLLQVAGVVDR